MVVLYATYRDLSVEGFCMAEVMLRTNDKQPVLLCCWGTTQEPSLVGLLTQIEKPLAPSLLSLSPLVALPGPADARSTHGDPLGRHDISHFFIA